MNKRTKIGTGIIIFIILALVVLAAETQKPMKGYVLKTDNITIANNATAIVKANIGRNSVLCGLLGEPYCNGCNCSTPITYTDENGLLVEDLGNLEHDAICALNATKGYNSPGDECGDDWTTSSNTNDTTWAWINGSTINDTQLEIGTTIPVLISVGSAPQWLINISLSKINYAPNLTGIPDNNTLEDTTPDWEIDLWQYIYDTINNESEINYSITTQTNASLINCIIRLNRYINCSTPVANQTGENNITIMALDTGGLNDTDEITITITPVNDGPNWLPISESTPEDTAPPNNWIDLYYYGKDIDNNSAELTYELVSQTNSSLINCSVITNRYLNCTEPTANQTGTNIVTLNVTDGEYVTIGTANITVIETNDPPYWITLPANHSIIEDSGTNQLENLTGYGKDPDNDLLTYEILTENTSEIDCGISGNNLTATPAANWTGIAQCGIRVYDNNLYSEEKITYINVTEINDPPFMTSIILNQTTGNNGTTIKITSNGAGDIDSTTYKIQCGDSSGNYNLCNSSLGTGERSCDFETTWTDDTTHPIYCVINDTVNISAEVTTTFTADNTAPGASTVNNLEGDTTPKYWDSDNDGNTILQLNLDESNMKCRWDETDLIYGSMNSSRNCTVAGTTASCNLKVTEQTNTTTRYISCQDQYGNDQNTSVNNDVTFGVDWSIPTVNDNNDGAIHLQGYTINLTIQDDPTGTVVNVLYCNDTTGSCSPTTSYTGTNGSTTEITFNQRGTWYLKWNATDEAGNINTTKQTIIFINTLPILGQQQYENLTEHKFRINITINDPVGTSQAGNFICELYHRTGANTYVNKTMTLISGTATDGIYTTNISITDGYSVFDTIDTYVNCTDGLEWNISNNASNQITNYQSTPPIVNIVPTNPQTTDDLLCNITINCTDPDNDTITYYYEWYKNGTIQNINNPLVSSGNTTGRETWNCTVTPNDGYENGTIGSDQKTIENTAPIYNISKPIQNITWSEDTNNIGLNLTEYFYDLDGDSLNYNYTTITNITLQINQGIVTFIPTANFTGIRTIKFNATDGTLWSNYSNEIILNITNVNDPPIVSNGTITTEINTITNINLTLILNYTDPDIGDTVTFTDTTIPYANATLNITNTTTGSTIFLTNNSRTYEYTINVTDSNGTTTTVVLSVIVIIPAVPNGIIITKNIDYYEQNSTTIIYEVNNTIYNFLGVNATNVTLIDNDANMTENFNLSYNTSQSYIKNATIDKTSTIYLFESAIAIIDGALYNSNQPRILIPGAGAFDINITTQTTIEQGQTIQGNITIESQGAENQDVIIEYWIEDTTGTIYDSGQTTIYVLLNQTKSILANLTAPTVGTYKFYAKVKWQPDNTSIAIAYDSFTTTAPAAPPTTPGAGGGGGLPTAPGIEIMPGKKQMDANITEPIYENEEMTITVWEVKREVEQLDNRTRRYIYIPGQLLEEVTVTLYHQQEKPTENNYITICHSPTENQEFTIKIPPTALTRHLEHGDKTGECGTGEIWEYITEGLTDEKGEITFTPEKPGKYKLTFEKTRYNYIEKFIDVIKKPTIAAVITEVLLRPKITINTYIIWMMITITITITIILLIIIIKRKDPYKPLKKYAQKAKKLGYKKQEVKEKLIMKRWPKHAVHHHVEEIWKKY